MSWIVDMSQTWSSVTPALVQWAQEERSSGDKRGDYLSVSHPKLSFTKANVATMVGEYLICKQ